MQSSCLNGDEKEIKVLVHIHSYFSL